MLWRLNAEYYEHQSTAAWSEGAVPSRISSNLFIADAYAEVILGYLRDVAAAGCLADGAKVTIIELGAGSGQFGCFVARALAGAVRRSPSPAAPFRYVMTDIAESNVAAWARHPQLQPLVDAGVLDLAVLGVGAMAEGASIVSGLSLAALVDGAPVVLIANYLFDSLVADAFRAEAGKLHEVRVGLGLKRGSKESLDPAELLRQLEFRQELAPVEWPYYPEPQFDVILQAYQAALKAATFQFPVAALRAVSEISELANGRLLLLVSDKARISTAQLEGHKSVGLHLTGAYASMVNLDAVARWVALQGGTAKTPSDASERFDTYGFVLGGVGDAGETEAAFDRRMRGFKPVHFSHLASAIARAKPPLKARAMLALMALTRDDPYVLARMEAELIDAIQDAEPEERAHLAAAVERSLSNVFSQIGGDVHATAGRLFHELGQAERALACYRQSIAGEGASAGVLFNMSLCHADLGDPDAAAACFQQGLDVRAGETGDAAAKAAQLVPARRRA